MKNFREQSWLGNGFFGACEESIARDEISDYFLIGAICSGIGVFVFGFPLDMLFLAGDTAAIMGFVMGLALFLGVTNMSRLYKGHGLPENIHSYRYPYNFPARAKEYFSLSNADRALYPSNILDVLRDPDLTAKQRHALDEKMRVIYDSVQEREKAKRLLAKREVDVEHILDYMKQSQESVAIETKTYKEYTV